MKNKLTLSMISLAAVLSFGANAASLVTQEQADSQNMQSMGTVSISGIDGVPTDIRQQLSQKAEEQGASSYRVIEARNEDNYHITAELYK
ncbi:peroxide/acid stress response protein YhcN [Erwinia tasmaniensis]|uniref:peroxide/acid stress response protein YhcN n=1 Tax=Erwinia tasmaniensis TaxID=338565 RepID=UPI003A4DD014